jgi:hypothetical protein
MSAFVPPSGGLADRSVLAGVRLVAAEVVALDGVEDLGERGLDVRGVEVVAGVGDRDALAACAPLAWFTWPLSPPSSVTRAARSVPAAMAVGAPAMASTPTRPAPGAAAPGRKEVGDDLLELRLDVVPAMLLCGVAAMALRCAHRSARSRACSGSRGAARAGVFTVPAGSAFGAPADASTPTREAPELPTAPVVRSSIELVDGGLHVARADEAVRRVVDGGRGVPPRRRGEVVAQLGVGLVERRLHRGGERLEDAPRPGGRRPPRCPARR